MEKEGPKIIYVSRVKTTESLAEKLQRDGFNVKPYNGKNISIKYSKSFEGRHKHILEKDYHVDKAEVSYIVVWMDTEENKEYRILLPKISYVKN